MEPDHNETNLACTVCGDDLSPQQLDEGEELSCEHCDQMSAEETDERLIRIVRRGHYYRLG